MIGSWLKAETPVFRNLVPMKFEHEPLHSVNDMVIVSNVVLPMGVETIYIHGSDHPVLRFVRVTDGTTRWIAFGTLREEEKTLNFGRFCHFNPAQQEHKVEAEIAIRTDIDGIREPVCETIFEWLGSNTTSAWNFTCIGDEPQGMMAHCLFSFEDEDTAFEFKLWFG
jgi:hypothetical protein